MITMEERVERRRNVLLRSPYQRRTLLSSSDDLSLNSSTSCVRQLGEVAAKRRKGLLSTPETGMPMPLVIPQCEMQQPSVDSKVRKRPALLPQSSVQVRPANMGPPPDAQFKRKSSTVTTKGSRPSIFSSSSSSSPNAGPKSTAAPTVAPSHRRVLLPFSSDDKATVPLTTTAAPPLLTSTTTPSKFSLGSTSTPVTIRDEASQKDSEQARTHRSNLFDYLSSDVNNETTTGGGDAKRRVNKAMMTEHRPSAAKSTTTDISMETDLPWLHQQRSLIDQRISELQDRSPAAEVSKGLVVYVNGYYCRACRKLIRGDYAAKVAHCEDKSHLLNADESATDPETVFKYFEEHYEGIAFDDDLYDDSATADSNVPESSASASPSDKWTLQQTDLKSSSESSSNRWINESRERAADEGSCVGERTVESDDEDERESACERFDRTRILRK